MADNFQRLLAGYRRAHRLLDILGIAYFQSVHGFRLVFATNLVKWPCLSQAIRIPDHPSKGVAERHKGELHERQRGYPPTGWEADSRADVALPLGLAVVAGTTGPALRPPPQFDRYRNHHTHNSSS